MPLFRTQALSTLKQWREPLFYGIGLLVSFRFLWLGFRFESWVWGGLGLIMAAVFGSLLYVTLIKRGMRGEIDGPGLVEIDERNITYLAPQLGGSVAIDSIRKIDVSPNRIGGHSWVLYQTEGPPLMIPFSATGADGLIEAFIALPGLGLETIRRATRDRVLTIQTIWQRA